MKQLVLTLGLCAVALATPSLAQDADRAAKAREMFVKADTDGDGALSLAEWKAIGRREQGFTMIDADKNGKVTPEELRTAAAKMRR